MRLPYRNKKAVVWIILIIITATMFLFKFSELRPACFFKEDQEPTMIRDEKYIVGSDHKNYRYSRESPLIFIGGVPRSGTTLMRAMLDAHPDVRCGQETRVIPRILQLRSHWLKSEKESLRLLEAGITEEVMNSAIAQFCLEVIAKHGEAAPRLCNKDPLTLKMGTYVIELFPNAKFLFMVRDGRATVHSMISRKVTITGFDLNDYRQCMMKWNKAIEVMVHQCKEIGMDRCMMVYYEQLVLHPEDSLRNILHFLDVPWNASVLHHEEFINKPNGVSLSKVERSSDQVIKPVNLEALSKWVGNIPKDVVNDMAEIAPMLSVLGYDPYANPPEYGKPDAWVQDNTFKLKANKKLWDNKTKQILGIVKNPPHSFDDNKKEEKNNEDENVNYKSYNPNIKNENGNDLKIDYNENDDNNKLDSDLLSENSINNKNHNNLINKNINNENNNNKNNNNKNNIIENNNNNNNKYSNLKYMESVNDKNTLKRKT